MGERLGDVARILGELRYRDKERTRQHAQRLLERTSCLKPAMELLTSSGRTDYLLCLEGTIETYCRGREWATPVRIYLPLGYPHSEPICFLRPPPDLDVAPDVMYADEDGLIHMCFLHVWHPAESNLVDVFEAMISVFSVDPPLRRMRPAGAAPPHHLRSVPLAPPPAPPPAPARSAALTTCHREAPAPRMLLIRWPANLPVPTPQQEAAVRPFLFKGPKQVEPITSLGLSHARRSAISAAAAACGMHIDQALFLRIVLLKDAAPWRFHGTEASSLEDAEAFEAATERFLTHLGVRFVTQAQQQARLGAQRIQGAPTPDFLLLAEQPVKINGARVHWIEVKNFYGCGVEDVRSWAVHLKMLPQAMRYLDSFGPGAVVFAGGYSSAMRSWLPPEIQLLDGSCLEI